MVWSHDYGTSRYGLDLYVACCREIYQVAYRGTPPWPPSLTLDDLESWVGVPGLLGSCWLAVGCCAAVTYIAQESEGKTRIVTLPVAC